LASSRSRSHPARWSSRRRTPVEARRAIRRAALAGLLIAAAGCVARGSPGPGPPTDGLGGGDWTTFAGSLSRDGTVTGPALRAGDAARLALVWRATLDGAPIASPLYVGSTPIDGSPRDIVIVATESGLVEALNAVDGSVVWSRSFGSVLTDCPDLPDSRFGIGGTPVIDRATSRVYVAASVPEPPSVRVFALALSSGRTVPGWPIAISGDPFHVHDWGALTLAGGELYVPLAGMCDHPPDFGRVVSIDVERTRVDGTWYVVRHGGVPVGGGGVWGAAGISIDASGDLYLATGNAEYPYAEGQPFGESVVRLSPRLQPLDHHHPPLIGVDVDFGSTPVLVDAAGCPSQLAVLNKDGRMYLYRNDNLAGGPVQTVTVAGTDSGYGLLIGSPAWDGATRTLVLADPGPATPVFTHGLIGFHLGADCRLHLGWQGRFGPDGTTNVSGPTIAGGVAYYGDGMAGGVAAFDEISGDLLWSANVGPVFAPPVVSGSRMFVAAWDGADGVLWAFAPGG
jgi:outer membrane protein assembly factor BamB